jgi:glycerate kinase
MVLNAGLAHLAAILGGDANAPAAGAAGGAGYGLATLCGARLERGVDLVLEAIGFGGRCEGAALVLTGEGRLDDQTLHGKAVAGVAAAAYRAGVPTIAIVGSTGPGADACMDPVRGGQIQRSVSLAERFGEERALRKPAALLEAIARVIVKEVMEAPPSLTLPREGGGDSLSCSPAPEGKRSVKLPSRHPVLTTGTPTRRRSSSGL